MADRPSPPSGWQQAPGSKNANEYSAEWQYNGANYASVVDVSTGTRSLYQVNKLGFVETGRTLISTTDSSGNVTKGSEYDKIINSASGGQAFYNQLDAKNKQNAATIIGKQSTPEEKQSIGGTTQYKSTSVGQNTEKKDLTDVNNSLFGTGEEKGSDIGLPGNGKALTYPIDMSPVQDRIEFRMIRYSPKGLADEVTEKDTNGGISGFKSRRNPYTVDTLGTVFLPIQNGIMDNNTVSWGQGDISPFEAAAAKIFLDGLKNGMVDAANTAEKTAKNAASPENKGSLKTAVAAILTNSAIGKPGILARTTGAIINPNVELLFNGPLLRPFTFTFKMSGRSKEEADEIKKIIYFFKKGMAVKQTKQGLFLKAPNTFTIKYKHGAKEEHPGLNLIKECALTSCTVNYTPDGYYSTHADGNLIAYEMQLQFSELEPIYYDDYDYDGTPSKSAIGY